MKNITLKSTDLIAGSYQAYRLPVYRYIYHKIGHPEDAEDLTQDVFLRLMEYGRLLCGETIRSFIFTIASNVVTDYLRRYYRRAEVASSYMYECVPVSTNETESGIMANDLSAHERRRVALLPTQRRLIYRMSRYGGKSSPEISAALHLSRRTVENHLFISRKEVREYMRQII